LFRTVAANYRQTYQESSRCLRKRAHFTVLPILLFIYFLLAGSRCFANPVPLVNQPLVPAAVVPGGSEFTLIVNGTGFVPSSIVNWNGSPRATTFVNASQLAATIPASDITSPGTALVTVLSPGPGGGLSNTVYFECTLPTGAVSLNTSNLGAGVDTSVQVVADFNLDGILDLAATNYPDTVSVLLGSAFGPPLTYSTGEGSAPNSLTVGDFNGDGKPDLASANFGNNSVSVLLGNGDGTFQAHVDYPTPGQPYRLISGDFNGDGKVDLAVSNSDGLISIFLGNGDGSLQSCVNYIAPGLAVAAGDFNRDGNLDLAVANDASPGAVLILLGNGDGSFQSSVGYPTGSQPYSVTTADFNGDGKLDLAIANTSQASNSVSVLIGNGDGTFRAHTDYPVGFGPTWITAADVNGDGILDLVTANDIANTVSVLLGNGDGTFQQHTDYAAGDFAGITPSVVAADFNKDGRLDLAAGPSLLLQAPFITVSPSSLAFGDQSVYTTSPPQTLAVTNTGSVAVNQSSISITGANASDFNQTNNCPAALAPGVSCTITVEFTPKATGNRNAFVSIVDNAPGSPQTIALTGTGVAPTVSLSPASLTFARQLDGTTSKAKAVTLANIGTASLTISGITTTGPFLQTHTCHSILAAGTSCTLSVFFVPTTAGPTAGTVAVADNAPGSPQTVAVSGIGTVVNLSTDHLSFGTQAVGTTSAAETVTVTNEGAATLTMKIALAGADPGDFAEQSSCRGSLAAGQSCLISVTFTSTAQGVRSAILSIIDNGGGSPQEVALTGTGI